MLPSVAVNFETENFDFPWPLLRTVLEGLSILDVPRLEIHSMEEATNFIHAYGYDPSSSGDIALIWEFFDKSIHFIEKTLCDSQHPRVPDHLRNQEGLKDIRRLLILASQSTDNPDQVWSCAILRLMHVLIHLAHDPRLKYFEQVQNQVLSRLDEYLYVNSSDGAIYLGKNKDKDAIKLLFFKKKDRKDRDREIIKLLHKAESTVEVILDRIGFRLVTETKYDAARAVRLLIHKNVISVPNIRPSRSRNWLIDLDKLQIETNKFNQLRQKASKPIEKEAYEKFIRRVERRIGIGRRLRKASNPHSSAHYHSIQFTCRELIKIRNSQYQNYIMVKKHLENFPGGEQVLGEIYPRPIPRFEYVFYPYEIQIMDVKSYSDSIFGKSNHDEYRRKQLEAARDRVFGRQCQPKKKG